jgi:hypothetical protein
LSVTFERRLFGGSGEPTVTAALGGVVQPMRSSVQGLNLSASDVPLMYFVLVWFGSVRFGLLWFALVWFSFG